MSVFAIFPILNWLPWQRLLIDRKTNVRLLYTVIIPTHVYTDLENLVKNSPVNILRQMVGYANF